MEFGTLDQQLLRFAGNLAGDVGLRPDEIARVASCVGGEVRDLDRDAQTKICASSPVPIRDRLAELHAFQGWMDFASTVSGRPAIIRAQVIVQNYVCFVYLSEATFRVLRKVAPTGSVVKRCCQFLTDNPVRAFRNALSHSNWKYREDFHGLVFWARKGGDSSEELSRFEVGHQERDFWQSLSRAVAYAAYTSLDQTWTSGASG